METVEMDGAGAEGGRVSSQGSHCASVTPGGRLRVELGGETSLETASVGNEIRNKLHPWQPPWQPAPPGDFCHPN